MIVGFWHNLGYVVDGDQLYLAISVDDPGRPGGRSSMSRPRFSITLCPKKIQQWRNQQRPQLAAAAAARPRSAIVPALAAPARSAASPCDPWIEKVLGLRMPPGTQVFLFDHSAT